MHFVPDEHRRSWTDWEFEGPRHPCFLCSKPVGEGQVVLWSGSGGSAGADLDIETSILLNDLAERGRVTTASFIFLHPSCVPGFCRRLLEDYERTATGAGPIDG